MIIVYKIKLSIYVEAKQSIWQHVDLNRWYISTLILFPSPQGRSQHNSLMGRYQITHSVNILPVHGVQVPKGNSRMSIER